MITVKPLTFSRSELDMPPDSESKYRLALGIHAIGLGDSYLMMGAGKTKQKTACHPRRLKIIK